MKPIVVFDASKYSDDKINMFAIHVIDCMTDNPNYPDSLPLLTDVSTARTKFEKSAADALNGGHLDIVKKNGYRKTLEEKLKILQLHVQMNCKNDLSILLSSGFDSKRESSPIGILPKPSNVKVVPGPFSGSIKLSLDPIDGAHTYVYKITEMPVTEQSNWEIYLGKKSKIIKDLVPGKQYAFQVAGKGSADDEVYSDIISFYVS